MAALSISRAWDEAKAVLRRDGRLYVGVALAMFVLPGVVAELFTPASAPGTLPPFGFWTILSIAALLISLVGQLAICRLALGPVVSVGEAIGHGARRAPAYVAAAMLWVLPFVLLFGLLGARLDPEAMNAGAALTLIILMLVFLVVAVRLLMGSPVATAERQGPVGILARSWRLTAGHWWKLFLFLLSFLVALMILLFAVSAVVGTVVALVAGPPEPMSVGALLLSLATQAAGAAVTVLLMVMLARIYVQLAGAAAEPASVPHAP